MSSHFPIRIKSIPLIFQPPGIHSTERVSFHSPISKPHLLIFNYIISIV